MRCEPRTPRGDYRVEKEMSETNETITAKTTGIRDVTVTRGDHAVGMVTGLQGKTDNIGRVYWVVVGQMYVPSEKMREHWEAAGLPPDFCPAKPRVIDAFKKSVDDASKESPFNTLIMRTAAVMVGKQAKPWGRSLAWGTEQNHAYPIIGQVSLRVANEVLPAAITETRDTANTTPEANDMLSAFVTRANELFGKYAHHNTDDDVRRAVMSYLRTKADPFMIRPGGALYFSPESAVANLNKVAALLQALSPYTRDGSVGAELAGLPVQEDSRDLVIRQFENIVGGELNDTIERAGQLLAVTDRKVQPSEFQSLLDDLGRIATLKQRYEEVLRFKVSTADALWGMLEKVSMQVASKVADVEK